LFEPLLPTLRATFPAHLILLDFIKRIIFGEELQIIAFLHSCGNCKILLCQRSLLESEKYRGADKSLARPTSRCILFDGENISFDASLVIYINSNIIPPIIIILVNRIYEHQNLLSL